MKQPTYRLFPLVAAAALFLMAVSGCTGQNYAVDLARMDAQIQGGLAAASDALDTTNDALEAVQAQVEAADADGDGAISWGELIGAGLASAAAAFLGTNGYRAATAEGRYAKKIGQAKALADATKG